MRAIIACLYVSKKHLRVQIGNGYWRTLVKKIDVLSTEKNGDTRCKMALFSALTLALNVGSWDEQG